MKDPLVKGHPLHAMLSDLPIGTAFAGIACDLIGIALRKPQWYSAARMTLGAAVVSGSAAALVGLWDYQAVPHDHPARRSGALYGYLNASALTLLSLSSAVRRRAGVRQRGRPEAARPRLLAVGLSLAAGEILVASGWLEAISSTGWAGAYSRLSTPSNWRRRRASEGKATSPRRPTPPCGNTSGITHSCHSGISRSRGRGIERQVVGRERSIEGMRA
jgi:uncharacterized membrane protein